MNKRRLSAASVLVCTLFLFAIAIGRASQPANWNAAQGPFRIIGNIYYVGTAGLGSFLITTPEGHILLDGALPESAAQIEQHVQKLGFQIRDVKYLLNSHAHFDHAGGLAALKQASERGQLVASAADAPVLESGFQSSYGAGWDSRFPAAKVDRIVKDGERIELGGTTMTARLTPGHTKGCTTWTMPVVEHGKTYQVVFYCSTSVPGYSLVNNRFYPSIAQDYERSFAILATLPCDVFLANHAEFFGMQEKLAARKPGAPNPFINSGELHEFVEHSKADFESKLRIQKAKASKRSGTAS